MSNENSGVYIQFFIPEGEDKLGGEIEAFLEDFVEASGAAGLGISEVLVTEGELDDFELVEDDQLCTSCGGSGLKKDEEEDEETRTLAKEAWNDLYAPVAQKEERFSPKEQVEGSNPSWSASNEVEEQLKFELKDVEE